MHKKLLTTAVGAALVVVGTSAHAVDAKISGHVNRAIVAIDDGSHSETHHVDNALSNSRFRFTGSEDMGGGITAGINWEMQFVSNSSFNVTQTNRSPGSALGERIQEVYFQGAFGKVSLGQGLGAADGASEVDLSGTGYVVSGALAYLLGNSITFRVSGNTALAGTGPNLGSTVNSQDFEGRYDRVRYDSPKLGPVSVSASRGVIGDADVNELAAWLNTDLGGAGKLAAAIGYSSKDVDSPADQQDTTGFSASWLGSMGLNVTVGFTNVENDAGKDSDWRMVQVGYKSGNHAVSLMRAEGKDQAANGDDAETVGVGYNFNATKGIQLYAGLHRHSLDRPGTDFDDISVGTVGSRIFF